MTLSTRPRAALRRFLVKAHWLIGISAGTLLMLTGLSGALLAFEDELLDAFNPGVRRVAARPEPALTPPQLLATLRALAAEQPIQALVFSADAGRSVEIQLRNGQAGGSPLYADPYTAAWLGNARGNAFFDWSERLHRFLLLPREPGRQVSGVLACTLLLLVLSGVYLRWPRQPLSLRAWFGFKRQLKGRAYWWTLHAVCASWALPVWLLLASTGIYWSFDSVRGVIDAWAGVQRAAKAPRPQSVLPPPNPDLQPAWQAFVARAPAWHSLRVRLPEQQGGTSELRWIALDAAHERQRNRMTITLDGRVEDDQRFVDLPPAKRALAAIHPLHMGSYFGLPGRLIMALAALALPLIGFSGWLLYLQRRRQQRTTRAQRQTPAAGQRRCGA